MDVVCPGRTLVQGKFGRCGMYRPIVETKVEETWTVRISDCRDMGFTDRSYKSILCRGMLCTVDGGPEGTGLYTQPGTNSSVLALSRLCYTSPVTGAQSWAREELVMSSQRVKAGRWL